MTKIEAGTTTDLNYALLNNLKQLKEIWKKEKSAPPTIKEATMGLV